MGKTSLTTKITERNAGVYWVIEMTYKNKDRHLYHQALAAADDYIRPYASRNKAEMLLLGQLAYDYMTAHFMDSAGYNIINPKAGTSVINVDTHAEYPYLDCWQDMANRIMRDISNKLKKHDLKIQKGYKKRISK